MDKGFLNSKGKCHAVQYKFFDYTLLTYCGILGYQKEFIQLVISDYRSDRLQELDIYCKNCKRVLEADKKIGMKRGQGRIFVYGYCTIQ